MCVVTLSFSNITSPGCDGVDQQSIFVKSAPKGSLNFDSPDNFTRNTNNLISFCVNPPSSTHIDLDVTLVVGGANITDIAWWNTTTSTLLQSGDPNLPGNLVLYDLYFGHILLEIRMPSKSLSFSW